MKQGVDQSLNDYKIRFKSNFRIFLALFCLTLNQYRIANTEWRNVGK